MNFIYLLLLPIFYGLIKAESNCKQLIDNVAKTNQLFITCAIYHAVPVALCINCNKFYYNAAQNFLNFMHNCSTDYIDKDRMNIVQTVHNNAVDLWEKAFCSKCYEDNGTEISNGTNTFSNLLKDFNSCLSKRGSIDDCVICQPAYLKLNLFYNSLVVEHKSKICFDLQDQMNRTRSHWSKDLKCCERQPNLFIFSILSLIVGMLPIIFYGGFFLYTKTVDRNHDTLIPDPETSRNQSEVDDDDFNVVNNLNRVSSDNHITASNQFQNETANIPLSSSDDDDSDYYPTTTPNQTNLQSNNN